jgi:hypothetical protein
MFNLEHAIAEWRQQMVEGGIDSSTTLDELEGHLRDDVERQTKSGADASNAFANAVKRIGPPATIKAEFKKVEKTIPQWNRALIRHLLFWFPVFYLCVGSYGVLETEMSFAERAWGFAAVAFGSLSVWCAPLYRRFRPNISDRRLGQAIIGAALIWIAAAGVFVNFMLPRLNLNLGQLLAAFLWLETSGCVVTVICFGWTKQTVDWLQTSRTDAKGKNV